MESMPIRLIRNVDRSSDKALSTSLRTSKPFDPGGTAGKLQKAIRQNATKIQNWKKARHQVVPESFPEDPSTTRWCIHRPQSKDIGTTFDQTNFDHRNHFGLFWPQNSKS